MSQLPAMLTFDEFSPLWRTITIDADNTTTNLIYT